MHAPLAGRAAYQRQFHAPVHFASPFDEIVFDRELMNLPVAGADPRLKAILTAQADQAVAELAPPRPASPSSFAEAVEQALGHGLAERDTTLVSLAERLGVSPRTVQRRLREAGLSHRTLVRGLRLELARNALDGPRLSQQQIARTLGYSGAGAFHRAFKRWSGITPGEARAGKPALRPRP
jgi:AraC-like DNA-binding protein